MIDFEALAKAAYHAKSFNGDVPRHTTDRWWETIAYPSERSQVMRMARAVVAAVREQGLVVARREDVKTADERLVHILTIARDANTTHTIARYTTIDAVQKAARQGIDALRAALVAAPGIADGEPMDKQGGDGDGDD